MSDPKRRLFLAVNPQTYGALPGAWRSVPDSVHTQFSPSYWQRLALLAEEGTFDAIFTGDGSSAVNPAQRASDGLDRSVAWTSVLSATTNIGVIVTISTTYNDPVDVAGRLLSLDTLSGGRVAWNVVTSYSPSAAGNFGLQAPPSRESRYRRAEEFAEVVTQLWESADTERDIRHEGENFTVSGRLRTPPSKQGRPPIIRASTSDDGRELAARYADGVFAAETTLEGARADRENLRADARKHATSADALSLFPGIRITLGSTEEEARRLADELYESDHGLANELHWLSGLLGTDARALDLDSPVPEEFRRPFAGAASSEFTGSEGFRASGLRVLEEQPRLTVREYLRLSRYLGTGHGAYVGTPEGLADRLEHWYRSGAADGFILLPDLAERTTEIIVSDVVPLLRRRGVVQREYSSDTFRGHLRSARGDASAR